MLHKFYIFIINKMRKHPNFSMHLESPFLQTNVPLFFMKLLKILIKDFSVYQNNSIHSVNRSCIIC